MGTPGYPYYPQQPYQPGPPPKKRNTTLIVLLSVFGAMFLLCGGCGVISLFAVSESVENYNESSSARQSTAIALPAPTTTADDARDKVLFAELIGYSWFDSVDNDTIIEKAHVVCTKIEDAGGDTTAKGIVLGELTDAGFPMEEAIVFMAASVKAYCPEYLATIR